MATRTHSPAQPQGSFYPWYVLFVLFLANAFNSVDRAMVSILVESIRQEFGFSDLQLGILSGLGFAIFYAGLGIPLARWADVGHRVRILSLGIAIWSGMTALTGRAAGFGSFLLARAGVGVGEASLYPTAYPLIGDYFTRVRRPIAMAVFQMGLFAGIVIGNIVAARIAAAHGWRFAFTAIGLPGLALAVLTLLTVREPVRGATEEHSRPVPRGSFGDMARLVLSDGRFLAVIFGTTLLTLASATLGNWGPAFMMRVHGISQAEVGVVSAPIGMGGLFGTIAGGFAGSWLAKRRGTVGAPLGVPIAISLLALPATLLFIFAGPMSLVVLGGAVAAFAIAAHTGPTIAVAVSLMPPETRGLASATIIIGHLLIGFGLGPVFVGLVSDALQPTFGTDSLRYGLLVGPVAATAGWAALFLAARSIRRSEAA